MNSFQDLLERQKRHFAWARRGAMRGGSSSSTAWPALSGERGGAPAGGRAGLQDRQSGADLRDAHLPRRFR